MRLDQLAQRLGSQIRIQWRAFLLRAEPKTSDRATFVEYTRSWLRPAASEPDARFRVWSTDNPQPTSSVPAHVAAKVMAEVAPDHARAFHRRLLNAYFADNLTISDPDVLTMAASEVGVDAQEFASAWTARETELTQVVLDEHRQAIDQGITAVPTVVLDGRLAVPGAQEVDVYETWIRRMIEQRSEIERSDDHR